MMYAKYKINHKKDSTTVNKVIAVISLKLNSSRMTSSKGLDSSTCQKPI